MLHRYLLPLSLSPFLPLHNTGSAWNDILKKIASRIDRIEKKKERTKTQMHVYVVRSQSKSRKKEEEKKRSKRITLCCGQNEMNDFFFFFVVCCIPKSNKILFDKKIRQSFVECSFVNAASGKKKIRLNLIAVLVTLQISFISIYILEKNLLDAIFRQTVIQFG